MTTHNPIDARAHALALYETATTTHKRQDWRQASHALAAVLMATAAHIPAPQPVAPAPTRKPVKAAPRAKAAGGYVMTAESLTKALKLVLRAVELRNSIPVLGMVLISGRGDQLTISGTNMDRQITATVANPDGGLWSAMCDGRTLAKVLSKASGAVTLAGSEGPEYERKGAGGQTKKFRNSVLTLAGAVTLTLRGPPVGDFPQMKIPNDHYVSKLAPDEWRDLLTFVKLAISTEETRYYLNGAYLHGAFRDGAAWLDVAASDGSRLNVASRPMPNGCTLKGVIVPRETVADILAIMAGQDAATVGFSESHVTVEAGAVTLTSRLIDGAFPDYRRVIPAVADVPRLMTLDAADLSRAIAKATAISSDKATPVRLEISAGQCQVHCRTLDGVSASETVAFDYSGGPAEISFNSRFLLDAIAVLKAPRITFAFGNSGDPSRITAADATDDSRLCVLMSIRT